jgi:REP element-mobilizing transposase RayT
MAAGGTTFRPVNLVERRSDLLVRYIDDVRAAMITVKDPHPFAILAMAVLPEHLHAIWRLPLGLALINDQAGDRSLGIWPTLRLSSRRG